MSKANDPLVQRAIEKLERGESLTEIEDRGLRADRITRVGASDKEDADRFRDTATLWLQQGYAPHRIKWLTHIANRIADDGILSVIQSLEGSEWQVLAALVSGEDPFATLPPDIIRAFDAAIR